MDDLKKERDFAEEASDDALAQRTAKVSAEEASGAQLVGNPDYCHGEAPTS